MKIKILSLRRSDSPAVRSLEEEYLKRLRKYASLEFIDIKRGKIKGSSKGTNREDARKIISRLSKDDYTVVLTESGKEFSSSEFAVFIKNNLHKGIRTMTFIIGGPTGFSDEIFAYVDYKLSLSRMTFPHKLTRLILIEALYRSFDILHGGPYHK